KATGSLPTLKPEEPVKYAFRQLGPLWGLSLPTRDPEERKMLTVARAWVYRRAEGSAHITHFWYRSGTANVAASQGLTRGQPGLPPRRGAEQGRAQMTVQGLKLAGVAIACFAFLAAVPGVALAQSKCTGGEIGAAGKKAGGKANSWAKATAAADCLTTVDQGAIETKVDNFAADVNSELTAAGATTTTTTSSTTTTTGACCGINPTRLNFTTAVGSGNCGNLVTSTGGLLENLACGGLYIGGGSSAAPL